MRVWCWLFAVLGCNAIFEENPEFRGDTETTGAVATDGSAEATVTVATTDVPTECGADMYEQNDTRSEVVSLADITTTDPPLELVAQVDDAADEDWFKITVDQVGATIPTPTVSVNALEPVRACIYISCMDGDPVVDCGEHEPDDAGVTAQMGCCDVDTVSFAYDCDGAVDLDGFMHVRLLATEPIDACVPYSATIGAQG